ncbi:hypothetical protein BFC17_03135 [Alteromonas lipolytica]|uniref:Uncharacterized protein n=1 Tax=Alteromonas lipolytica TaxID=1856405 RepID=A0A1E8FBI6_9ALTE|nr:hypothetical protein BFC17_03135 [Alteromonas lipolytica]
MIPIGYMKAIYFLYNIRFTCFLGVKKTYQYRVMATNFAVMMGALNGLKLNNPSDSTTIIITD